MHRIFSRLFQPADCLFFIPPLAIFWRIAIAPCRVDLRSIALITGLWRRLKYCAPEAHLKPSHGNAMGRAAKKKRPEKGTPNISFPRIGGAGLHRPPLQGSMLLLAHSHSLAVVGPLRGVEGSRDYLDLVLDRGIGCPRQPIRPTLNSWSPIRY